MLFIINKSLGVFCHNLNGGELILKKPFVSLKKRSEKIKLSLCLLLSLSALLLFFIPRGDIAVFAGGNSDGIRGLFNIVNGWIS